MGRKTRKRSRSRKRGGKKAPTDTPNHVVDPLPHEVPKGGKRGKTSKKSKKRKSKKTEMAISDLVLFFDLASLRFLKNIVF